MYNIASIVDYHAAQQADAPFYIENGATVTAAEFYLRTNALAAGLADAGVRAGDRVALLLWNRGEFLEAFFAITRLGAVVLPLNHRLAVSELRYIVDHAAAGFLITETAFAEVAAELQAEVPSVKTIVTVGDAVGGISFAGLVNQNRGHEVAVCNVASNDLQRLMYTSGTTSRPKGVCITHGNVLIKNLGLIVRYQLSAADRTLVCGPMYHVGAFDLPGIATLHVGGALVIMSKFDARGALEVIARERPSNVWLAPSMMNLILQVPELPDTDTGSVRFIVGGGEKMPEPLVNRILSAFPGAWFADAYGLTETVAGDTALDQAHSIAKIGSVGRAIPHVEVSIQDEAGSLLPPGTPGEVCLRGPKVFTAYWRDPEATSTALRGGWFHSGDIGRLDEDGFLYIEDRLKDMIVSGGENISSPEVERVLYEHDGVLEAAVVAHADERWGQVPHAFVVLRPGNEATANDLREFCQRHLAKYKVPKYFTMADALPRNSSGKVLKRELRDIAAAKSLATDD